MKITTRHFGEIEVEEKDIISFPRGVVGFEDHQKFTLLRNPAEEPFIWMQFVGEEELSFVLVDPLLIDPKYDFEIDDDVIEELAIQQPSDIQIFVIVTVRDRMEDMTANMMAPVVINIASRRGMQLVLSDSPYLLRQPLFADSAEPDSEEATNG